MMISQQWLGVVKQQYITCANVEQYLSLGGKQVNLKRIWL